MQILLIRHGKPQSAGATGDGSQPNLSFDGNEQARRLPDALSKFSLARIVSSPWRPAVQTASPVADHLGLSVDIDERFADYDHDLTDPVDPSEASMFVARVRAGIDDVVAAGQPEQVVAVFTHDGVINAVVHSLLRTESLFSMQLDYTGITRLATSGDGGLRVGSVNVTDHVWDVLYRTQWWTEEH